MRRLVTFSLAAVIFAGWAGLASALPIAISGTHDRAKIKSVCANAGGDYYSNLDGYGCINNNCTGGPCAVVCENNGKCTGSVPQTVKGAPRLPGIEGILKPKAR
jgi:hypothetical protein